MGYRTYQDTFSAYEKSLFLPFLKLRFSAVAGQKFFGGGPTWPSERNLRVWKFLKFSFLKLLKMHQILKARQLTYIPPVQGYCLTIKNLG